MRHFTRHQKAQRLLDAGIVSGIDQSLVDDLGPRLGGDVRTQIRGGVSDGIDIPGVPKLTAGIDQRGPATEEHLRHM